MRRLRSVVSLVVLLFAAGGCEDDRRLRVVGPTGEPIFGTGGDGGELDGGGGGGGAVATCGDGVLQAGERCDGMELGGLTCADVGFIRGGTLRCSEGCDVDTSACFRQEICDNGIDDNGDGAIDCADVECRRAAACSFCGDAIWDEAREECDGPDSRTCAHFGFRGGSLACGADCRLDLSGCSGPENCGFPGDEDRDGLADCDDPDCADEPRCRCGDGVVDPGEECDGGARMACTDRGFDGGTYFCTSACRLDTSGCWSGVCGDGVLQAPREACDDGNTVSGDGCNEMCRIEGDDCDLPGTFAWDPAAKVWAWEADTSGYASDYQPSCVPAPGALDAVGTFIAPETGTWYARVHAAYDTVLAAWQGSCGFDKAEMACRDELLGAAAGRPIELSVGAGARVHLYVAESLRGGGAASGGPFRVEVGRVVCGDGRLDGLEQCDDGNLLRGDGCSHDCRREAPSCVDAYDLNALGGPGPHWPAWFVQAPGDFLWVGSTSAFGNRFSGSCVPTEGRDAVARFVAPASGWYNFELFATFDAAILVYFDHCPFSAPSEYVCSGKLGGGPPPGTVRWEASTSRLPLSAGEEVYVVVDGIGFDDAEHGDFWLLAGARGVRCGNGQLDVSEECDDGNVVHGDGCSPDCALEPITWAGNFSPPRVLPTGVPLRATMPRDAGATSFLFEAEAGVTYSIRTQEEPLAWTRLPVDTLLRLRDPTGTLLVENDDADPTTVMSRIDWTAPSAGIYELEVGYSSSFWPIHLGPYELLVPVTLDWIRFDQFMLQIDEVR